MSCMIFIPPMIVPSDTASRFRTIMEMVMPAKTCRALYLEAQAITRSCVLSPISMRRTIPNVVAKRQNQRSLRVFLSMFELPADVAYPINK